MEEKKEIKAPKKKIPRARMPQQKPGDRIKNFNEVELGLSGEDAIRESTRCLQCKKPRCIEDCPVGIDIKSFIKNIEEKEFDKALDKSEKATPCLVYAEGYAPRKTSVKKPASLVSVMIRLQ